MRPVSSAATNGFWSWSSPLPYLFGGLTIMMSLIAVALIVLVCTRRKSSEEDDQLTLPCHLEKPVISPLDMEPRIVVIMAGDDMPKFLAKPLAIIQCKQQDA